MGTWAALVSLLAVSVWLHVDKIGIFRRQAPL